jgi:4-hydroxybenzoyl-CoA reductase subunit beta
MRLKKLRYAEPKSLSEALSYLSRHSKEVAIKAGGTDLLVAMKQGRVAKGYLLNLKRVRELSQIREHQEYLEVGALITLHELAKSRIIQKRAPILAQAASLVGASQVRHMGTLGGNICLDTRCAFYDQSAFWRSSRPLCLKLGGAECYTAQKAVECFALFCADLPPCLIALGAEAQIASPREERSVPVEDLYSGDGKKPLKLETDEILKSIRVPFGDGPRATHYLKYRTREALDFPIVGVAVVLSLKNGQCDCARICLTGVLSQPFRTRGAEECLTGRKIDESLAAEAAKVAAAETKVVSDLGCPVDYRKKIIQILVARSVMRAVEQSHESSREI